MFLYLNVSLTLNSLEVIKKNEISVPQRLLHFDLFHTVGATVRFWHMFGSLIEVSCV